jgi:hypothetical protein
MAMDDQGVVVNEAFTYQLDFHEDTLWFVLEPHILVTSDGQNLALIDQRRTVANRVMSGRYNAQAHEKLLFWLHFLSSVSTPISFVFPPRDDIGVRIVLDSHYAFSSLRGALKG